MRLIAHVIAKVCFKFDWITPTWVFNILFAETMRAEPKSWNALGIPSDREEVI